MTRKIFIRYSFAIVYIPAAELHVLNPILLCIMHWLLCFLKVWKECKEKRSIFLSCWGRPHAILYCSLILCKVLVSLNQALFKMLSSLKIFWHKSCSYLCFLGRTWGNTIEKISSQLHHLLSYRKERKMIGRMYYRCLSFVALFSAVHLNNISENMYELVSEKFIMEGSPQQSGNYRES